MEAVLRQDDGTVDVTVASAITGGQVVQLPDGRAGVHPVDVASGALSGVQCDEGLIYRLPKTADINILDGGKVFWDYSANKAHFKKVNDRDFYVGTAVGDSLAAATTVDVCLNVEPRYVVDLARDPFDTTVVGTQAAGGLAGPYRRGGAHKILITATNEAQKVDALSKDGFATGANAIVELAFAVPSDGAGTVVDVSMGIANGTHASDADSITESLFVHLDANATKINIESDDGTTEVAATDSTKTYTEGADNRVEVWFDMRDPADVQVYVDAVNVLPASVFNVAAAVGPWRLLAHVEKSASTDTYELDVDWLRARISE